MANTDSEGLINFTDFLQLMCVNDTRYRDRGEADAAVEAPTTGDADADHVAAADAPQA